MVTLANH